MVGKIIVIEGTDSSGKETQAKLLEKNLNKLGKKCIHFSFPMYDTPTGKIIKGPVLGNEKEGKSYFKEGAVDLDPYISCLYYAADRKYNMKKVMKYVEEGYYVILDRYTPSNLAHQGSKIMDKEERFNMYQWIDKLEYWLLKLPKPDKTIFLHVPYQISLEKLKNKKEKDDLEKSPLHLKNTEEAYIELSELYNWDRIECVKNGTLRSIEEIGKEMIELIEKM